MKRAFLALVLLLGAARTVRAEGPRPVTLPEALALASKQSPDLAVASAQAQVVRAGVKRAWTAWQPDISATGTFDHTSAPQSFNTADFLVGVGQLYQLGTPPAAALPAPTTLVASNSRYGTLQITQPLFTPQGAFLIPAAYSGAEAAALGAEEAREQVLLGTARAYLSAAAVDELLAAAREAERTALQRENEAHNRLNAGVALPIELSRAQSETANARAQIATLEGQKAALQAALQQLTGEPIAPSPGGAAGNWGPPAEAAAEPWAQTFAVKSAQKQVEAQNQVVRYDKFLWLPTVAGVAKGNYNSNSGFAGKQFSYDLILTATLPIYDRGTRYAAKSEDEAKLAQAEASLQAAKAKAQANWEGARANLAAADAAMKQAEAALALAEQVKRQTEAARESGASTNLELAQADTNRFLAASALAQARATLEIRKVEIAAAEGRLAASLPH